MPDDQHMLDYYATPGPLTHPGKHSERLKNLPDDVEELVQIVQHLSIYDVVASDFYGVTLTDERAADIHLRSAEAMLDTVFSIDNQPLTIARSPEQRISCRCHAYTRLLVTLLRVSGIPARSRCGFALYLSPEHYEDHWVCEYWNKDEQRWILIDAQLDAVWQKKLHIQWNALDVPRDQFMVAAGAWALCRSEEANPDDFGISFHEGMHGLWFVAGNLVRDAAALNKMELLPWDVWGAAPVSADAFDEQLLTFYDQLAALTHNPDSTFNSIIKLYSHEDRVGVPEMVFNNMRQKMETVNPVMPAA